MKRTLIVVAVVLAVLVAGCGGPGDAPEDENGEVPEEEPADPTEDEPGEEESPADEEEDEPLVATSAID